MAATSAWKMGERLATLGFGLNSEPFNLPSTGLHRKQLNTKMAMDIEDDPEINLAIPVRCGSPNAT